MILVVDDHPSMRQRIVRLLASEGYEAIDLSSGRECLQYLETTTPSLIVLDYQMPEMTGFDVLHAIRAHAKHNQLPVMIASASGPVLAAQSFRCGANSFVDKGSSAMRAELFAEVRRLIGPVRRTLPASQQAA